MVATTDANNGLINFGTLAVNGHEFNLQRTDRVTRQPVNDAGLTFSVSTVGGNLSATATTGNIKDNGKLTIAGTSSFSNKCETRNAFTGAVALTLLIR